MGTRSLTILNDNDGQEIVVMYRQMDGYPSGHGKDLAEFLKPFTIVNGLGVTEGRKVANGGSCLAALAVSHFKGDTAGDIYLHPAGTRDAWEEYRYHVTPKKGGSVNLKVECLIYGIPPAPRKASDDAMANAVVEGLAQQDDERPKYFLSIFDGDVSLFDVAKVDAAEARANKAAERATKAAERRAKKSAAA
jgi:hypothetical protein